MLDVFLELEVLWLLMMFLKINNALNYIFAILNSIAKLKFDFFFYELNFLKIHIKASFSIVFSPMIDVFMCIKVKSPVTFKNIYQI